MPCSSGKDNDPDTGDRLYQYLPWRPASYGPSGKSCGFISAGDFIINTSNVNAYEKTELTLYFANSTGDKLVEEKRDVAHNINTSMEQLIVEQLIAGPSGNGHQAVPPSDCKILSVSVTDNVCYINFDSAFLNSSQSVNEYIPIYAIVNCWWIRLLFPRYRSW